MRQDAPYGSFTVPAAHRVLEQIADRLGDKLLLGAGSVLDPETARIAMLSGADIIKLFPSEITGPKLIKAIHGPMPQIPLMPTGGVNLETAGDFIRAGACALGMGSTLAPKDAIISGDMKRIESLARQFIEIVKTTREEMAAGKQKPTLWGA